MLKANPLLWNPLPGPHSFWNCRSFSVYAVEIVLLMNCQPNSQDNFVHRKNFSIMTVSKFIVNCSITDISTVESLLCCTFTGSLWCERDPIYNPNNIWNYRLSVVYHQGKLLHFFWGQKFNFCPVMTMQAPYCEFNHNLSIYENKQIMYTKNQAQMTIIHCADQVKNKGPTVHQRAMTTYHLVSSKRMIECCKV